MSYSSDSAEQVVRMTLEGTEVALKITGAGAKQLLAIMYAILTDKNKTSGKVWLSTMLKNGKELKVLGVKDSEMSTFVKGAETYGITYVVLKDRDASDGRTDVLIKAEDMSRINRMFDRYHMTNIDMEKVRDGIAEENKQAKPETKTMTHNDKVVEYINSILPETAVREAEEANPSVGLAAEPHQSWPKSTEISVQAAEKDTSSLAKKPSVVKEIESIVKEEQKKPAAERSRGKNKTRSRSHSTKDIGAR